MSDPLKLVLTTPGVSDQNRLASIHKTFPDATFENAINECQGDRSAEDQLIDDIKRQYEAYGTLKEVVIDAHGNPGHMSTSGVGSNLNITDFLSKLHTLQGDLRLDAIERGRDPNDVKLAERIVFNGCDTMVIRNEGDITQYTQMAKSLGTDIVGATSILWSSKSGELGQWVRFGKDGSVGKDTELHDTDSATLAEEMKRSNALHKAHNERPGEESPQAGNAEKWMGSEQQIHDGEVAYHARDLIQSGLGKLTASAAFGESPLGKQIEAEAKRLNEALLPGDPHAISADLAKQARELELDIEAKMQKFITSHETGSANQNASLRETLGTATEYSANIGEVGPPVPMGGAGISATTSTVAIPAKRFVSR